MRSDARRGRPGLKEPEGPRSGGAHELSQQPALADAGGPHERDHLTVAVQHGMRAAVQEAQLGAPANERAEPAPEALARPVADEAVVLRALRSRPPHRLRDGMSAKKSGGGGGDPQGPPPFLRRPGIEARST